MHYFHYKEGTLHCEEVPIRKIVEAVGTPLYIYSHRTLERHFRAFQEAFREVPHLVCFSVKANSNLAVLRTFINLGGGLDVVSGGELFRGLQAGVDPEKVVFAGVGKSEAEIGYALRKGVLMFNVESGEELSAIEDVARRMGCVARVALRVNPDVDPQTHPYIATGLRRSKFGIDIRRAEEEYLAAQDLPHLSVEGLHCHIGSQIVDSAPFVDAVEKMRELAERLKGKGLGISYLNLGGGLGITYKDEAPPHPRDFAEALLPVLRGFSGTFILEPGRVIVGNAGILVARVLYTKSGEEKHFVIADAAMNDLIRPSLYGSFQDVIPVEEALGREEKRLSDLVGPICESGDFLARDRELPPFSRGDLLAVMSAGAYGFTMSSNYNSRPRAAEVMVRGREFHVVRRREAHEDLIRGEEIPDFLKPEGVSARGERA